MYCCIECGNVFDEEDVSTWKEGRGEYWGNPCSEDVCGCPNCAGNYVETHRCDCCSRWINDSYIKLESGERICVNCYTTHELGDKS